MKCKFYAIGLIFIIFLSSFSIQVLSDTKNQNFLSNSNQNNNYEISSIHNQSLEGYTLFGPEYGKQIYLMKNDGTLINRWESNNIQGLGIELLKNGNLVRSCSTYPNPIFPFGGFTGRLEMFNWNGSLIWEFDYSDSNVCLHHDIEVLPNGNILLIAWELITSDEVLSAGKNPEKFPWTYLASEHIIEIKPDDTYGGEIVWEWHLWDHLIQDYDSSKNNYGIVSEHPELVDINFEIDETVLNPDNFHINSIDYNEKLDQILLSVRNYNEIWIIDHSTTTSQSMSHEGGISGKGGDILYRWGNPETYDKGTSEDRELYFQHDANWIDEGMPGEGNILIFNNGPHRPQGTYSSIDEINPPLENEYQYYFSESGRFGPFDLVWTYTAEEKTDFYSNHISSAQRISNGNTLICEGDDGYFFEVSSNKETVWEYQNQYPLFNPLKDVFKIKRYTLGYEGIGEFRTENPLPPDRPTGETNIKTGQEYTFSTVTTDPDDGNIIYWFDWGDGTNSGWIGPFNSGRMGVSSHMWNEPGTYEITVIAQNMKGLLSGLSEPLNITVEGLQVFLLGKVDSRTVKENEISLFSDKLVYLSVTPFDFEIFNYGVRVIIDKEYKGILNDHLVFGKFVLRYLN
ncbi:hypothetical protein B6U98_01690 [Thermoplasmatales archaeon ex4572_165]|nr:MAG: hypothetical protein B6U98_01690 [Thermoplasmatales archaeon ex4572_165]